MDALFTEWRDKTATILKALEPGCHPKTVIAELGEGLLAHYAGKPLIGDLLDGAVNLITVECCSSRNQKELAELARGV